jgi:DNA-binding SARP family transcriptional activator
MGKRAEAFSVYRRLKHLLSVMLGAPPSAATEQLFREMLQRQRSDGAGAEVNRETASMGVAVATTLSSVDVSEVTKEAARRRARNR